MDYLQRLNNAMLQKGTYDMAYIQIFPSIKEQNIIDIFRNMGYSASASMRLADICCFNEALPQGAPTSPYLANLECKGLDFRLNEIATNYGLVYTRYADDMTFSGDRELDFMISLVEKELKQHDFVLNPEKTRIYGETDRKIVTGLVVKNDELRIPKQFKRKL